MSTTKLNLTVVFLLIGITSFCQGKIDSAAIEKNRSRWNNSLVHDTSYVFNKKPNALLIETIKGKNPGRALDIGMGQGRNSIFLTQHGWKVTGFDIADEAVNVALQEAKKNKVQLDTRIIPEEAFDYGIDQWDLVVNVYEGCLDETKMNKIAKAMKKGGLFVFEFFHNEAGKEMGRPNFGCTSANVKEVIEKAKAFKILLYKEENGMPDYTGHEATKTRKLIKLVAQKK
jgi:SAM-dependent methyltransferase